MHVLTITPFKLAASKYPNDKVAILDTYKQLKINTFRTPEELKAIFQSLDNFKYVNGMYVIDIGGGNLRLLALIRFKFQKVFVDSILTHAEYAKRCKAERRKKPLNTRGKG